MVQRPRDLGGTQRRIDLCQSKIENLGMATFSDEDVGRLEVAVNDSLPMRGVERVRNFNRKSEQGFSIQGTTRDTVFRVRPSRYSMAMKLRSPCLLIS